MSAQPATWRDEPEPRRFAGVTFGRQTRRLKVALVQGHGSGWGFRLEQVDSATFPQMSPPADSARPVADHVFAVAQRAGLTLDQLEVVGLGDQLVAGASANDVRQALACELAELLGITVVTDFAQRDRVSGGRGAPLDPVPNWVLHRSFRLTRLVVRLASVASVTVLPADSSLDEVMAFDAGPGCEFLDGFTQRLSNGRYPFDPSGHFAVQGRQSDLLLQHWSSHPYLLRSPPKVLEAEQFGAEFREASLTMARECRLSARDVLCSANAFVANCVVNAVRRFWGRRAPIDEVWITGGGAWNGFLWRLLRERFAPIKVNRCDDLGLCSETVSAQVAAILAYLTLENLPGNLPHLTGARGPRVLGAIHPGAADQWERWVLNLADRVDLAPSKAA